MTPWVKRLLVTNVIVFLVVLPGTLPYALLTLFPPAVVGLDQVDVLGFNGVYIPDMPFRPWTLFTYMFLHAGMMHLIFNMIGLFFFGPRLDVEAMGGGKLELLSNQDVMHPMAPDRDAVVWAEVKTGGGDGIMKRGLQPGEDCLHDDAQARGARATDALVQDRNRL